MVCLVDCPHGSNDLSRPRGAGGMDDEDRARSHSEERNVVDQCRRGSPDCIAASISRIAENAQSTQLLLVREVILKLGGRLLRVQFNPTRIVDEPCDPSVSDVRTVEQDGVHAATQSPYAASLSLTNCSSRHSCRYKVPAVDDVVHPPIMSRRGQRMPESIMWLWTSSSHPQPIRT